MPGVYYLCDWSGESGGIKVLYDHVRFLREAGVDAYLASRHEFVRAKWFTHDDREIPSKSRILDRIGLRDTLVLPEFCMRDADLRQVACRQMVFVQNMSMITGSPHEERYAGLIVSSVPLARAVRKRFQYSRPIHIVLGLLESELIIGRREPPRECPRVLIVDRPGKHHGEPEHVYKRLAGEPSVSVTYVRPRMDRSAFVCLFRDHDIYLHLGYPEGFPVSILEAFGAGCLVIGFAGLGGLQFMRDGQNCFVAHDGDSDAVIRRVLALESWSRDGWSDMLRQGLTTARRYDVERARRGVHSLAADLLGSIARPRPYEWTA